MAAKKKKKKKKVTKKPVAVAPANESFDSINREPRFARPTRAMIEEATQNTRKGNKSIGLKEAPYTMRKGFRHYTDRTVKIVWDFYSKCNSDGVQIFSQAHIARITGLPRGAVGNMCRCMPEDYGDLGKRKKR